MNKFSQLSVIALQNRGIIKSADLYALKIEYRAIQRLIKDGVLEKIKYGIYRLKCESDKLSEIEQVAQLFPDGILCMYAALFYYGYIDKKPTSWDIAFDKNVSKSRFVIDYPVVQPHYHNPRHLAYGVALAQFEHNSMFIFSRDRLICECLYFEKKIDYVTFNNALQRYRDDEKKNIAALIKYAVVRSVLKKVDKRFSSFLFDYCTTLPLEIEY